MGHTGSLPGLHWSRNRSWGALFPTPALTGSATERTLALTYLPPCSSASGSSLLGRRVLEARRAQGQAELPRLCPTALLTEGGPHSQSIVGKQMKNNRKERRNWRREGRGNATSLCWEKQNLCISAWGRAQEQRSKSRAELRGSGHHDSNPSCTQLRLQPAKQNLLARRSGPCAAGKSTTGQEWCINRVS